MKDKLVILCVPRLNILDRGQDQCEVNFEKFSYHKKQMIMDLKYTNNILQFFMHSVVNYLILLLLIYVNYEKLSNDF